MKIYIVIPAHNEEANLGATLDSLTRQTLLPTKLCVVNDNSTDRTETIAIEFSHRHGWISAISTQNSKAASGHEPGGKVVRAFQAGLDQLDRGYDVICKFDADLIFPPDYLEKLVQTFESDLKCGIVGGFCYIEKDGEWKLEGLTGSDHIRGALKAYRKPCFEDIGGLKPAMGWDTLDEMLARYHGWEVTPLPDLHVKHLKPTGATYASGSGKKQGQAFRRLRYGWPLAKIASAKLAWKKRSLSYFFAALNGYASRPESYLVTKEEGKFIRAYRWSNIKKRLFRS